MFYVFNSAKIFCVLSVNNGAQTTVFYTMEGGNLLCFYYGALWRSLQPKQVPDLSVWVGDLWSL